MRFFISLFSLALALNAATFAVTDNSRNDAADQRRLENNEQDRKIQDQHLEDQRLEQQRIDDKLWEQKLEDRRLEQKRLDNEYQRRRQK
jgi:hypothetical protein